MGVFYGLSVRDGLKRNCSVVLATVGPCGDRSLSSGDPALGNQRKDPLESWCCLL